jgi:hypothetical protein
MMMFWCVLFVWVAAVRGGTETAEVTTSTAAATAPVSCCDSCGQGGTKV